MDMEEYEPENAMAEDMGLTDGWCERMARAHAAAADTAQGERECLRGQVAQLQQRVTELQSECHRLRRELQSAKWELGRAQERESAAMRLIDAEAERFAEAVRQLR